MSVVRLKSTNVSLLEVMPIKPKVKQVSYYYHDEVRRQDVCEHDP